MLTSYISPSNILSRMTIEPLQYRQTGEVVLSANVRDRDIHLSPASMIANVQCSPPLEDMELNVL